MFEKSFEQLFTNICFFIYEKKDNFLKSCRFAELIYKAAQFQTFCDYRKTTIKLLSLQKQYYCKY